MKILTPRIVPRFFLVAMTLSFSMCIVAGRLAGRTEILKDEVRLSQYLNPMSRFYPTASLLKTHALADLRPEQTLVLIGGNSNFNGQGQNPDELWSLELQKYLGDRYKVVNFATMGSESADLAGVVFRMIEPERPDTILVYNTYGTRPASWDGADGRDLPQPFTYFFWDAYYKGLIPDSTELRSNAARIRRSELSSHYLDYHELHIGAFVDSFTYARDLWTYVDYEFFSSIWLANRSGDPFSARKTLKESIRVIPTLAERIAASGMSEETLMENVRSHFVDIAKYDESGQVVPVVGNWNLFIETHRELFLPAVRSKILVCVLAPSPEFVRRFDTKDQALINYVRKRVLVELQSMGYQATSIGEDFDGEDYEFSFHFVASGGRKVASIVADQVSRMKAKAP